MKVQHIVFAIAMIVAAASGALISRMTISSPPVLADQKSEVQLGYEIAPVPLNLKGRNPALVGKGSYLVNAKGDCNGCHNSPDLGGEWSSGHNPFFFGQTKTTNPAGYLGGGVLFATFPGGAKIYARNLTPDSTGRAEGGATLSEFITIMRTGKDFDHAHPACPATGAEGCITGPPTTPINADVLQIMPWPVFGNMSDDDLTAIYEYLSAIPCISHSGTAGLPSILYNTCPI